MKLITSILVVTTLVLIKQCQSAEEKTSGLYCPKSDETNLMTTVVSGCKVHYTCKNGSVLKIFQCSESQPLEGTSQACEGNPQCLRINFLQEFKNLPMIVDKLKSLKSEPEIKSSKSYINSSINAAVRFFKCLVDVDNIDELSKTCIDSTLFQSNRTTFFPTTEHSPNRTTRSTDGSPDQLDFENVAQALRGMFSTFISTVTGNEDSLTSQVILPIIFNMTGDEETMFNLMKVFWSSNAAFDPLIYEMLKLQTPAGVEGEVIRIPRELVVKAKTFFHTETKPIIRSIFKKHLEFIRVTCSKNTNHILDALNSLQDSSGLHVLVLKDHIERFVQKHLGVLESSDSTHFTTYTITEIKKDLMPIRVNLLLIAVDYIVQLNSSFFKLLQSFLFRALMGEEVYAVPSRKGKNSRIVPVKIVEENEQEQSSSEMSNSIRGVKQIETVS